MDKTQKRALTKWLIFLGPILIAPIIGIFMGWYQGQKVHAKESYVKLVGKAIDTAEQSYHQEWKKYSASLEEIGFGANMKDVIIFTKTEHIPEADLKKIKKEDYPKFEGDSYQMILKFKNEANQEDSLWLLDETGIATKL